jgi:hypothetical protein
VLDLPHDQLAFDTLAEDEVLAIEVWRGAVVMKNCEPLVPSPGLGMQWATIPVPFPETSRPREQLHKRRTAVVGSARDDAAVEKEHNAARGVASLVNQATDETGRRLAALGKGRWEKQKQVKCHTCDSDIQHLPTTHQHPQRVVCQFWVSFVPPSFEFSYRFLLDALDALQTPPGNWQSTS